MADTLIIAGVVAASSTFGPVLVAMVQSRNRRKEKEQDYARQDAVAKQAAEAARLLVERQDAAAGKAAEAANLLAVNTAKVAATAQEAKKTLDTIHTLVNSNLTASMQAEFNATVREAAMMQEVIDLKRAAGVEPTIETLATLESTKSRISELNAALADRLGPSK
jgi:DNA anti-recombination protein RmuC